MSETARIADQMQRAYTGGAWHGPALSELLGDVTADVAANRPLPRAHSIWELVLHVTAWKSAIRERLHGKAVELAPQQDWPAVNDTSAPAWQKALNDLERAQEELQRAVSALPEARLNEKVPGCDYNVYFMLHGVVQHDLYHAGQIAILKKA